MESIDKNSLYYIFLEVLRLHHMKVHKMLEKIGLYPGQPQLLFILNKDDGKSQKELAKILRIKPSTINVMIKRMEKENLIQRRHDDEDQRISRVYTTDKGKQICEKANKMMQQMECEMFLNLTKEEKIILRRLFLEVKGNLSISEN